MSDHYPVDPVDQFVIEDWRVGTTRVLESMKAVFHVNTSFRTVWPDYHIEGPPLVNEWVHSVNGRSEGRSKGWNSLRSVLSKPDVFLSWEAAAEKAKGMWVNRREIARQDLKNVTRNIIAIDEALRSGKPETLFRSTYGVDSENI